MPKGGKRPNAGRKKGFRFPATLKKEQLKARLRELVAASFDPLVQAQIANANGLQYLVYRNKKTGKFERVKALEAIDQDENTIEVWEKDPSAQAFSYLMDQAIDRPVQPQKVTGEDGGPVAHVFKWQK